MKKLLLLSVLTVFSTGALIAQEPSGASGAGPSNGPDRSPSGAVASKAAGMIARGALNKGILNNTIGKEQPIKRPKNSENLRYTKKQRDAWRVIENTPINRAPIIEKKPHKGPVIRPSERIRGCSRC